MSDREWWSDDRRFGLRLAELQLDKLLRLCQTSDPQETGGVLVGFYTPNHDCAIVTDVSESPSDSKRSHDSLYRGTRGLQGWLDRLWHGRRQYYLGEWHYHPRGEAAPSSVDQTQMRRISENEKYHCPEPILAIVGGLASSYESLRIFVFPRKAGILELQYDTRCIA
jgi:integrative and conjugative element protein (TIGR02256 family)